MYSDNVSLACRNPTTLYNYMFTKTKDKVEKFQQSNVVYQIKCNDCNAVYVTVREKRDLVSHFQVSSKTHLKFQHVAKLI